MQQLAEADHFWVLSQTGVLGYDHPQNSSLPTL